MVTDGRRHGNCRRPRHSCGAQGSLAARRCRQAEARPVSRPRSAERSEGSLDTRRASAGYPTTGRLPFPFPTSPYSLRERETGNASDSPLTVPSTSVITLTPAPTEPAECADLAPHSAATGRARGASPSAQGLGPKDLVHRLALVRPLRSEKLRPTIHARLAGNQTALPKGHECTESGRGRSRGDPRAVEGGSRASAGHALALARTDADSMTSAVYGGMGVSGTQPARGMRSRGAAACPFARHVVPVKRARVGGTSSSDGKYSSWREPSGWLRGECAWRSPTSSSIASAIC